jgi:hypothetical protein
MEDQEHDSADSAASATAPAPEDGATQSEPAPRAILRDLKEWRGKELIDRNGEEIGRLEDVYFDVETDQPQFGTVREGLIGRHLTFAPLAEVVVGPDSLQVAVTRAQVKQAPNIELQGDELSQADESSLYHYYELNYTPSETPSGRRLARR